jgi:hypothetical protein
MVPALAARLWGQRADVWARVARRFAVGCGRFIWDELSAADRDFIAFADRANFGEGGSGRKRLRPQTTVGRVARVATGLAPFDLGRPAAEFRRDDWDTVMGWCRLDVLTALGARWAGPAPADASDPAHPWHARFQAAVAEANAVLAELLRCLGDTAVSFDPRWRTEVAVGLAETIHAGRLFDRLPILADALEEAGCDDAAVLRHARRAAHHARGCWVVEAVRASRPPGDR